MKTVELIKYIKEITYEMFDSKAPESCKEIEQLLLTLPPKSSFHTQQDSPQEIQALTLLEAKRNSSDSDEILYLAQICLGKYHRLRLRSCDWITRDEGIRLLKQYYELTNCTKIKCILDNIPIFYTQRAIIMNSRQNKDDYKGYDKKLSTSRDVDSEEWKK